MSLLMAFVVAPTLLATPGDGLGVLESKYYIVETDLPADRAQFIGQVMDATGAEYARLFKGFRGVIRERPKVRVFAEQERTFAAVERACGWANPNARGIYCPADGIVYTYDGDYLETILKHECFHQFADRTIGGRLPRWTNEGLAEYFEEGIFDESSGRLRLGAVPKWRMSLLRKAREEGALFPVDRLIHLGGNQWAANMADRRGAIQYSRVWLLCHFLIHGDGGQYTALFDKFLGHLDHGLDWESAFKRVFGPDTRPLETKLVEYLDELKPSS